ncbi:M20 family metallopeptidase [Anaerovoracaceae bacterium 42-11]
MHPILEEAMSMKEETIAVRRQIHENAELGFDLPKTRKLVTDTLSAIGCTPKPLGEGITCTIGSGAPVILLRADMDALPQTEDTNLPFASQNGACHSCGHDAHTAMLLTAAKILKAHESQLAGTVKLMFQAGEETLLGSQKMIDAGILENPKVDAAMGLHMNFGPCGNYDLHPGTLAYSAHQMMPSADEFRITVKGRSAHGSSAFQGISAVSTAAAIVTALQQLLTLELPADEQAILSIGSVHSGNASNIIPDEAVIMGNFRAYSPQYRELLKTRVSEIAAGIASAWRAEAVTEYIAGVAPNVNDPEMAAEMAGYAAEIMKKVEVIPPVKASEDFANLCTHVPTFFANVCAGSPEDGYVYSMHNPKAVLDEDALPYGAAVHVNCAINWLANHQ